MKNKEISLSVPTPCSENWDKMEITGINNRFCASCQHHVIDFSMHTDRQIAEKIKGAGNERICGRFTSDQLHRPLKKQEDIPEKATKWKQWAAGILVLAGFKQAISQTNEQPIKNPTTQHDSMSTSIAELATSAASDTIVIHGTVLDSLTHEPIFNALVFATDLGGRAKTDFDGQFTLKLSGLSNANLVMLRFENTMEGYEPFDVLIDPKNIPSNLVVHMRQNTELVYLQGEMIVGIVAVSKKELRKNRRQYRREERRDKRSN